MTSTTELTRPWRGPVVLSYGFRPFFLGAALWAVLAMGLWIAALFGVLTLPSHFAPAVWHAHEFLYGYLPAVIAGFLLTAVPNWTRRPPIKGWPLGGLVALWLIGRAAVAFSEGVPFAALLLAVLAMPVVLAVALAREIVAGKNWRNLIVLGVLAVFILGNAIFLIEDLQGANAAKGYGLRLGLGAAIMMTAVIGGRIIPAFTRNWLNRQGKGRMPAPPMQRFDKQALLALAVGGVVWALAPQSIMAGVLLILVGVLHLLRLMRWAGDRVLAEPLLWVLHLAYLFLPLGALALGLRVFWPGLLDDAAAQHLWMAGVLGLMTLAVMSRATLGHTGHALSAGRGTVLVYLAMLASVVFRVAAGAWPEQTDALYLLSGLGWLLAFGGFALLYGPLCLRPRKPKM